MCSIIERELGISAARLPYREWLDVALEEGSMESLQEFFDDHFLNMAAGTLVLSTEGGRRVSPTLRCVGAVDMHTVQRFLKSWRAQGLLV